MRSVSPDLGDDPQDGNPAGVASVELSGKSSLHETEGLMPLPGALCKTGSRVSNTRRAAGLSRQRTSALAPSDHSMVRTISVTRHISYSIVRPNGQPGLPSSRLGIAFCLPRSSNQA